MSKPYGISADTKIGLGIGIPFGVAALIGMGLIAYFLRLRGQASWLSECVELVPAQPYEARQCPAQTLYEVSFAPRPPLPTKNWDQLADRRGTIRYEMPAGNMSLRELRSTGSE